MHSVETLKTITFIGISNFPPSYFLKKIIRVVILHRRGPEPSASCENIFTSKVWKGSSAFSLSAPFDSEEVTLKIRLPFGRVLTWNFSVYFFVFSQCLSL